MTTRTGTEKRARLWGLFAWETTRADTMRPMLDSAGAEIRMTAEGKIWFQLIDDLPTSEITLTPDDMYDFKWSAGRRPLSRPNVCRVSYYSPERGYDTAEINLVPAFLGAGGRRDRPLWGKKPFDVDLPFCPSAAQAQRIARRLFAIERPTRAA